MRSMATILRQLSKLWAVVAPGIIAAALLPVLAGTASAQLPYSVPGQTLHSVPGVRASQTPRPVINGTAILAGHYDPTQMLRLAIVLLPPHPVEEGQFLQDLQDKSSPLFHQYLTPEDWTARFGPSAEDEQAVVDWAQIQGFTITYRSRHRMVVDVEATAGTIEKALGITINKYQVPNSDGTAGEMQYSADRDPLLPPHIASVVGWVSGLNSFERVQPASGPEPNVVQPDYVPGPAVATQWTAHADAKPADNGEQAETSDLPGVSPPDPSYDTPQNIWSSGGYDYLALMNQGHCCNPNNNPKNSPPETSIAIAGYDPLSISDVANFQSYFSYLGYNIETIGVDGGLSCSPSAGTCGGEASLDNEWAIATANNGSSANTAKVYYYNAPNGDSSDVWTHIMDDGNARVMSSSWGHAEPDLTDPDIQAQDSILATMAGEGWTMLFDSGDQGSTGACNDALKVRFPASDPNVVGVGGTTLQVYLRTEVGWTGSTGSGSCSKNGGGSTGGFSDVFPVPSFQSTMGFSSRAVPDMALNASVGQDVYVNNGWAHLGGTSIATPMLAGFMAQENAYLLSLGDVCGSGKSSCGTLGNVNYVIYEEGNNHNASHLPFYDITSGCSTNDITQANTNLVAWCAKKGFDEVTGWGSANMLQLAYAINWELTAAIGNPSVSFSGPATNKWYNSNQNVSWTVVDNSGSSSYNRVGIAGFNQGWDSVPTDSTSMSSSFSIPTPADTWFDGPQFPNHTTGCLALASGEGCSGGVTQGCHIAHVRGWNNQGVPTGDVTYGPLCYDTVAPTVAKTFSPALPSSGWFTTPVKVSLAATDPGGSGASGIANTYYTDGSGTCTTASTAGCTVYGSAFTVSAEGYNLFAYFTEDNAGNFSNPTLLGVNIDETAPTTTSGFSGTLMGNFYESAVTIVLTATDSLSGVKQTTYTVDGGATTTYSGSFNVSTPGSHTITYTSTDIAGNVETTQNQSFVIESPVSTALSVSPATSVAGTSVKLTASLMPTLSGGTPSGSVTFYNGSTMLGSANLSGLTATLTTSALPVGSDSLTAVYGGATYYLSSTSATTTATVNAALSISPTSLSFPSTAVGSTSAVQTITLTNNSMSPVSFTASTTITGSGASSFIKTASTCTNPLPAGASCTNSIEFKPTTAGTLTATVNYTDNAPGSTNLQVNLVGTGTSVASLSLSATSLTFPATAVGSTSAVQMITLTNTGTAAVSFTASTTITGSGASSFIKSASTCTNPLPAGSSCTNSFEFKPTTTGALAATVTYTDNATGSPNTVALSGTGGSSSPTLSLSATSLTFPATAVGSTSAVQMITLTNTGTSAVSFTASTTITGSGASSFIKSASTCTNPLPAGASCTNSFEFKPTTNGALAATVTYTDNATGSPNTVALSGTGGSSTPTLSLSASSLTFPTTTVGSTSAVQMITLTNTGTVAVTFTASTTITGTGASSFTKSASTCSSPLAAGASCTNSFEFKPTTTGALAATVTYSDNATGSPNTVALSGTGN